MTNVLRAVLLSLLGAIAALLATAALWLAWQNRGSEKAVTAILAPLVLVAGYYLSRWFVPGSETFVTAGLVALVALVGVIAFTPPASFKRVMGATFLMAAVDRRPVFLPQILPGFPFQRSLTLAMQKAPDNIWSADNDGGAHVYHHLLQRAILEMLLTPKFWWGTESERYVTSTAQIEMWKPRKNAGVAISAAQITREFAANQFIAAPLMLQPPPGPALVAPKGTILSGKVPDERVAGNETGVVRLRSRFFELTIETRFSDSGRGVQGRYALMIAGKDRDPRFDYVNYMIRVARSGS